jgi:hypothetical protein
MTCCECGSVVVHLQRVLRKDGCSSRGLHKRHALVSFLVSIAIKEAEINREL